MIARCHSYVIVGVEAQVVAVEAAIGSILPGFTVVGLADTAISESRDRVRAALAHSGVEFPKRHVTVALLPASLPKRGSTLDVAIAIAVMIANGQLSAESVDSCLLAGELGLDGTLHPVRGVLAATLAARAAGLTRVFVPTPNAAEASLVPDVEVNGVHSLSHLLAVLLGQQPPDVNSADTALVAAAPALDLADVRGQFTARLGLEIAAAGGHHLAMLGSPGVGKTLLAQRLPGLLPTLNDAMAIEVTSIRSVAGQLDQVADLIRQPPFESPHHTASAVSVIGGGQATRVRIGSVTLAHRGVLFLDEAPEFPRQVLDSLRQPLESGEIRLSRADFATTMPARFQLVIAANPCPCGRAMGTGIDCSCTPMMRRRYSARLSGPILDRIDLRLSLEMPGIADLEAPGEATVVVADRVRAARERSAHRWALADRQWHSNAEVPGPSLRHRWGPDDAGRRLLSEGLSTGSLTMRGADRVLRVAWTLADLAGRSRPGLDDVGYAMSLRGLESTWAA